jgi:T3SS negative regulator,GrlR
MISGIYHVHFRGGPSQNFGEGIAVFKDGKINGGDVGYVFRGSYETTERRIASTINVKRWNPSVPNPLVNVPEYDLVVEAEVPGDWANFTVSASAPQIPQLAISISCRRIAEVA